MDHESFVIRRCFNILCSLLVLATYLWGGCVSCEQFFMVPGAKSDCCKHGKCKQTSQSETQQSRSSQSERACATMPFSNQGETSSTFVAVPVDAPIRVVPASELSWMGDPRWLTLPNFDPFADSPPDLVLLTSSFPVDLREIGFLPLPWHAAQMARASWPKLDHGRGVASERAAFADESSGDRARTCCAVTEIAMPLVQYRINRKATSHCRVVERSRAIE